MRFSTTHVTLFVAGVIQVINWVFVFRNFRLMKKRINEAEMIDIFLENTHANGGDHCEDGPNCEGRRIFDMNIVSRANSIDIAFDCNSVKFIVIPARTDPDWFININPETAGVQMVPAFDPDNADASNSLMLFAIQLGSVLISPFGSSDEQDRKYHLLIRYFNGDAIRINAGSSQILLGILNDIARFVMIAKRAIINQHVSGDTHEDVAERA